MPYETHLPWQLEALARHAGVIPAFRGGFGEWRAASVDIVLSALRALGVPISGVEQASELLAERTHRALDELVPPCLVAWEGSLTVPLHVRADRDAVVRVTLWLESGRMLHVQRRLFELEASQHEEHEGTVWAVRALRMSCRELGYHHLEIELGHARHETMVIAAPMRAYTPKPEEERRWGLFAPLYALREQGGTGIGDLGTLGRLRAHASERGASYLATLPLLAGFFGRRCEPSPYMPVSRLFWNELYLDLSRAPGLTESPAAREILASSEFAREASRLAAAPLVDYAAEYALRRQVIDALARSAFRGAGLCDVIARWADESPRARDYAAFRAFEELRDSPFDAWPHGFRDGVVPADALSDEDFRNRYHAHLYAQWAMDEQLRMLAERDGAVLYLDLPLGVHRDGYDVWRERESFARDVSLGAPPDALFSGGQSWGLPPLLPEVERAKCHRYTIECVRHHMRRARMLRIDHVVGLWQQYWVPRGASASEGVYVRQHAGELLAILTLESVRHACALVGEDLGTVPEEVRPALERHGLARMWVAEWHLPAESGHALSDVPEQAVAGLATHDTPTFAGFWRGRDIHERLDLGLTTPTRARDEQTMRSRLRDATRGWLTRAGMPADDGTSSDGCLEVMRGVTRVMAASPAHTVLVSLEDLWGEERPQNVPGTARERPNWRRPMSRTLQDLTQDASVCSALDEIAALRRVRSPSSGVDRT